ncbi:RIP metalloprotease [bacterium]|jgi:regulator of sigma E protease|nr:RIP metalloprotease [bacterium]
MTILLLVISIVLFISLVIVHEYGHFITARRNGVEVEEFGIFFPPALYKKKTKDGWVFSINALPLGGFVKLKGEHDSDTAKGSYGAASVWSKTKILVAGVTFNLITALVMFTILALIGMPKLLPNQFTVKSDTTTSSQKLIAGYIEPDSPAAKAGLKNSDQIVEIQQQGYTPVLIDSKEKLPQLTKAMAGKQVKLFYKRGGYDNNAVIKLRSQAEVEASRKTSNPKGYLGIAPSEVVVQRSTWSAPVVAVGLTAQITELTFKGLGHALHGLGSIIAGTASGNKEARQNGQADASSQVSGPVGIVVILKQSSTLGIVFVLFIIAVISLTLAIMNILPIPALDGGRLFLMLSTRAVKKPLNAKQEELINAAGFFTLIGLIILVTMVDVKRFF